MPTSKQQSGPSRSVRATLILAAGLPFLASLDFHWIGPRAQPAAPGPERPGLAFEQYLVDLGAVPPRPFEYARFQFRNRGDAPVTIRELVPSCGCLNPQLEKRLYQPNETGEFFLRVATTREKAGQQEYYVQVHYDDPQPREVELTFRLVLPEKQVTVHPAGKMFFQYSSQPITQEFVVTDYRERSLEVLGVACESELVTAELGPAETGEGGNLQYRITVTVAGNVPAERFQPLLVITTNDPDYARIHVPLVIEGRRPTAPAPETATRLPQAIQ